MNRVIAEPLYMTRHVWAEVGKIGLLDGVPPANQFPDGAGHLNYVPVDQRGRQEPQVADALLLFVGVVFLDHAFDTKLQPLRQRMVAFDSVRSGRDAAA